MDGNLSYLCGEDISFDADNVSNVHELLENRVVERLVFARANFVSVDIDLYATGAVLKLGKGSLTHDAFAHDTAGNGDVLVLGLVDLIVLLDGRRRGVYRIEIGRIRINPQFFQLVHRLAADNFLFAQCHFFLQI